MYYSMWTNTSRSPPMSFKYKHVVNNDKFVFSYVSILGWTDTLFACNVFTQQSCACIYSWHDAEEGKSFSFDSIRRRCLLNIRKRRTNTLYDTSFLFFWGLTSGLPFLSWNYSSKLHRAKNPVALCSPWYFYWCRMSVKWNENPNHTVSGKSVPVFLK